MVLIEYNSTRIGPIMHGIDSVLIHTNWSDSAWYWFSLNPHELGRLCMVLIEFKSTRIGPILHGIDRV